MTAHPTDDLLREAAQAVLDRWDSLDWKAAPTADYMNRLRAALAAAPQPLRINRGHLVATISNAGNLLGWRGDTIADDLIGRFDITLRNAAAPQPAPAPADERAAMIDAIVQADDAYDRVQGGSWAGAIADALLAAGWTRGGDAAGLREAARELCDRLDEFSIRDGDFEGMVRDYLKNVADAHIALGAALARPSAPETLAWGIIRKDGEIIAGGLRNKEAATNFAHEGERVVLVAIRVMGDEA